MEGSSNPPISNVLNPPPRRAASPAVAIISEIQGGRNFVDHNLTSSSSSSPNDASKTSSPPGPSPPNNGYSTAFDLDYEEQEEEAMIEYENGLGYTKVANKKDAYRIDRPLDQDQTAVAVLINSFSSLPCIDECKIIINKRSAWDLSQTINRNRQMQGALAKPEIEEASEDCKGSEEVDGMASLLIDLDPSSSVFSAAMYNKPRSTSPPPMSTELLSPPQEYPTFAPPSRRRSYPPTIPYKQVIKPQPQQYANKKQRLCSASYLQDLAFGVCDNISNASDSSPPPSPPSTSAASETNSNTSMSTFLGNPELATYLTNRGYGNNRARRSCFEEDSEEVNPFLEYSLESHGDYDNKTTTNSTRAQDGFGFRNGYDVDYTASATDRMLPLTNNESNINANANNTTSTSTATKRRSRSIEEMDMSRMYECEDYGDGVF